MDYCFEGDSVEPVFWQSTGSLAKVFKLRASEAGAVTILFHANGCVINTVDKRHFKLADLLEMNLAPPATPDSGE